MVQKILSTDQKKLSSPICAYITKMDKKAVKHFVMFLCNVIWDVKYKLYVLGNVYKVCDSASLIHNDKSIPILQEILKWRQRKTRTSTPQTWVSIQSPSGY